ncbi:MAG: hypothetical protein WC607_00945 [Candidatus Micrarchaeia archaeon]
MKGKIKLVFFDYGDILVPCSETEFHAYAKPFLEKRSISPADESRAWKKFKHQVSNGRITLREAQERAFKSMGN